jgi:hypothetical protein
MAQLVPMAQMVPMALVVLAAQVVPVVMGAMSSKQPPPITLTHRYRTNETGH